MGGCLRLAPLMHYAILLSSMYILSDVMIRYTLKSMGIVWGKALAQVVSVGTRHDLHVVLGQFWISLYGG
jgi:hypothetical protein